MSGRSMGIWRQRLLGRDKDRGTKSAVSGLAYRVVVEMARVGVLACAVAALVGSIMKRRRPLGVDLASE